MTKYPEFFASLAAPFGRNEVKARSQGGRSFHYVSARTVQNRLDDVAGPENWWAEFTPFGENGVVCKLTVRLPDGSTVTKSDVGGFAGMADAGDDEKSGVSDALKRAAVNLGIARYLYGDGVPAFARSQAPAQGGETQGEPQGGQATRYESDIAPDHQNAPSSRDNGNGRGDKPQGPPRSGKAMFAWSKDQEQKHDVALIKYLNQWAKLQDFPGRMVEWDEDQVKLAYEEATRKIASVSGGGTYEEALSN